MRTRLMVFFLLLLAFLGRGLFPTLDPPYLSWSTGLFSDPGFYYNNARSLVLTGELQVGDWDNSVIFPVYHSFVYLLWTVLPYGATSLAMGFAAVGTLTAALLYLVVRRETGPTAAGLALAWAALAAPVLLLGRVAVSENLSVLILTAILAAVTWQPARRHFYLLLTLVMAATAVKYSALFIIPAAAMVAAGKRYGLVRFGYRRQEFITFWLPLITLTVAVTLVLLWLRPPVLLSTLGDKMTRYQTESFGWREICLPLESNFYWRMPLLTLSAYLMLSVLLWRRQHWSRGEAFSVAAVAAWYLSIVFVRYNPLRYQLVIVPFIIYLAAGFWGKRHHSPPPAVTWWRAGAWWLASAALLYSALYVGYRSFLETGFSRQHLVIAAALLALLPLGAASRLLHCRFTRQPAHTVILAIAIVVISGWQIAREWQHRDDALYRIGRGIADTLPAGATVAGWYAPATGLFHHDRVFTTYSLSADKIRRHRLHYLLLQSYRPGQPPYAVLGPLSEFKDNLLLLRAWEIPRIRQTIGLYKVP